MLTTVPLALLWIVAFFMNTTTPQGHADRAWIQTFSLLMIIFFCIIFAMAYFPKPTCSAENVASTSRLGYGYARENFQNYHWCGILIVAIVVLYPFIAFWALVMGGFNPYEHLSIPEQALSDSLVDKLVYFLRVGLHYALLFGILYMVAMAGALFYIKMRQSFPGQYTWVAVRMNKLPFGAVFFQEGENFDCGICYESIYSITGSKVVRLACNKDTHVFH